MKVTIYKNELCVRLKQKYTNIQLVARLEYGEITKILINQDIEISLATHTFNIENLLEVIKTSVKKDGKSYLYIDITQGTINIIQKK